MASIMFDGSISATIAVRGKSYTLVGSGNVSALTAGSGTTVQLPSVRLVYHAPFSDAISLGTLDSQLDGASSLMQDIIAALHLPAALDGEIATLRTQLKALPGPLVTFAAYLGTVIRPGPNANGPGTIRPGGCSRAGS